jgi:hypothetical protein
MQPRRRKAAVRDPHRRDPERLTKAAVEVVAWVRCLRQPTLDLVIGRYRAARIVEVRLDCLLNPDG